MNRLGLVTIALSLCLAFTLGSLYSHRLDLPGPEYREQARQAHVAGEVLDSAPVPEKRFSKITQRLRPSVVCIYGEGRNGNTSSGTGVVLNRSGDILTNLHVIEGMRTIVVTLSSHERYRAEVVGSDAPTDLAVLRIAAGDGLHPVVFGDSEYTEVGEEVLAIGNALGFGWTVTGGIISSLHRSSLTIQDDAARNRYRDFIQTDAALGPGNSGGPLVNMRGEVIGINSLLVSDDRTSKPIGFAIPSADALFVANELISGGAVVRGFLGIQATDVREMTRYERRSQGIRWMHGVLLRKVEKGSPAQKAGLRTGDVILEMNGSKVPDFHSLRCRIARTKADSEADFLVLRDGETHTASAVLTEQPTS